MTNIGFLANPYFVWSGVIGQPGSSDTILDIAMFKLALNQMAMTCSDVTKIDVSDVQHMSQMADLNGSDSVSMSPPWPPSSRSLVSVI
jgi:hypothetical protein